MKTLLPFILSIIFPGTGQIILKKYLLGIVMIATWLILGFFIPRVPFEYFYFGTMIWSLIDIYIRMEEISGRTKAVRYLIFSIITVVVIVPAILILSTATLMKGGRFVRLEYFGVDQTKDEMADISDKLDFYFSHYNQYPSDYESWVGSKPIWSEWKRDSWNNKYRYAQTDATNYILTSSGKDGEFDTGDDIIRKSE